MSYDNGSPPDDIAAAASEVLTEIGVAPTENGSGTSATATASSLGETARVLLASPSTHPERRGSNFIPLAGEETAHGQPGRRATSPNPSSKKASGITLGESPVLFLIVSCLFEKVLQSQL